MIIVNGGYFLCCLLYRKIGGVIQWVLPDIMVVLINVYKCMYINTWRKGEKKKQPGFFQWCPVTRPEEMEHIVHPSLEILKSRLTQDGLGQPVLGSPAWIGGWTADLQKSRSPFQHQYFCDYVINRYLLIL